MIDENVLSGKQEMVLALIIGAIAGLVGFVPIFAALQLARKHPSASVLNAALYGLAGVFVSLVVLVIELIVCAQVARDIVLPFGLAEMAALVVSTAVYVARKNAAWKSKER